MGKYSIGIDFGLTAGSAVLVDVSTGTKIASATKEYTHGNLGDESRVLHHPMDYLEIIQELIPTLLSQAEISKEEVVGLGIDLAKNSVLPVMKDGTPLCFFNEYAEEKTALVRLANDSSLQLDTINEIASDRDEAFLSRFGGKVCDEGIVALVLEIVETNPAVYDTADYFMEASDWIIWQLTGVQTRNAYSAGFGAMWSNKEGYPDADFFSSLNPKLSNLEADKFDCPISQIGAKAGNISPFVAEAIGLSENTAVAVANVAEQAIIPALSIGDSGKLLINMDKTTTYILLGDDECYVPGICGTVYGAMAPDLYGYKAVQTSLASQLEWFANNLTPATIALEAEDKNICIHKLLAEKASEYKAGESGVIAIDWIGGNASHPAGNKLSGLFLGMTEETTAPELYRALIEASAFGLNTIVDNFEANGIGVDEIYATGEFALKNKLAMQIFANALGIPVKVKASSDAPMIGSAILGALAAGEYETLADAASTMGIALEEIYIPDEDEYNTYYRLYQEYNRLTDYFGNGANNCMKRLANMKTAISELEEAEESDEAVADIYEAVAEIAESLIVGEEETEEIEVEDIEIPTEDFDALLDTIDESDEDIEIENIVEDELITDEEFAEAEDNETAEEAEAFAEILEDQLEADDIDFEALDDLAKIDGAYDDGDVVAEATAPEEEPNPEIEELIKKYDDIIIASVPGEFEPSDLEDELEEIANSEEIEALISKYDTIVADEEVTEEVAAKVEEIEAAIAAELVTDELVAEADEIEAAISEELESVSDTAEPVEAEELSSEATPEETASESEEMAATPEETASEPEEVAATPEETTSESEEVAATPEETTSEPEEVAATPEETTSELEEVTTEAIEEAVLPTTEPDEAVNVEVSQEVFEDILDSIDEANDDSSEIEIETAEEAADVSPENEIAEDEEVIPVPTLNTEFPEFSHSKVRTNSSIPDDFWKY